MSEPLHDAEAYLRRGNVHRAKGEIDKAIADYSCLLEMRPKVPFHFYIRGETRLLAKDWAGAQDDLSAALLQGVDAAAEFQQTFGSADAFEQKTGIRLPTEIADLLKPRKGVPFEMDKEARIALAMRYYASGELSSGLAARLAGVIREKFWHLMGDYGLSPFSVADVEVDKGL